jgi:hypothetical protein
MVIAMWVCSPLLPVCICLVVSCTHKRALDSSGKRLKSVPLGYHFGGQIFGCSDEELASIMSMATKYYDFIA